MKKKNLSFSTSIHGELSLNLNDNRLTFSHLDLNRNNANIPITISHIYQNNDVNKGYGKGFSLNLEQVLSKNENEYTLSFPNGDKEVFEELYYYKDNNGNRVYNNTSGNILKRSDITLLYDGNLEYNGNKVYQQIKTKSNYTLKTNFDGYINGQSQVFKNENIETIKTEIREIGKTLINLEHSQLEYTKYSDSNYNDMLIKQRSCETAGLNLSVEEVNKFNELIDTNNAYYDKMDEYYHKTKKVSSSTRGVYRIDQPDSTPEQPVYEYRIIDNGISRYIYEDVDGAKMEDAIYRDEYIEASDAKLEAYYHGQVFQYMAEAILQEKNRLENEISKANWTHSKALNDLKKQYNEANDAYLNAKNNYEDISKEQIREIYSKLNNLVVAEMAYYNDLQNIKEYELEKLINRVPENYIIDNNGINYGFNLSGILCVIFDSYEQSLLIEYNNKNQIDFIMDENDKKIQFYYDANDNLIEIKDELSNSIRYEYNDSYLTKIKYFSEDEFVLEYSNDKLSRVCDIDNIGYEINYNNDSVLSISKISGSLVDSTTTFTYDNNHIMVVNSNSNIATSYIFDENKSLLTEYKLDNNVIKSISSYEKYNEDKDITFSFTDKAKSNVILSSTTINSSISYEITPINDISKDYVLFAFAKANSNLNINKSVEDKYYSYSEAGNGYFEIKCVVDYSDEQLTYRKSFNPNITSKQLVVLPFSLRTDIEGNVIIPNSIYAYLDYSNNSGSCIVNDLTLALGDYVYCEYNQDHNKVFEDYSESICLKTCDKEKVGYYLSSKNINYQYDINNLLSKKIDNIEYREYDLNSNLINLDNKEFYKKYKYSSDSKLLLEEDSYNNVIEYQYDDKGNCILKKSYSKNMPSSSFITKKEYDNGRMVKESNELGNDITYSNSSDNSQIITSPNGNIINVLENDDFSINSFDSSSNNTIYDKGRLIEYINNNMSYRYTYDEFNREKEMYINDNLYCSFSYERTSLYELYKTVYNNNKGYLKTTDKSGKTIKIQMVENDILLDYISYEYDDNDNKVKEYHYQNNKEYVTTYNYIDNVLVSINYNDYIKYTENDIYGNLSKEAYEFNDSSSVYQYTYDKFDKLTDVTYNNSLIESYKYDKLNRLMEINNPLFKERMDYLSKGLSTTNLISLNQKNINGNIKRYTYNYDKEGNIISKDENHEFRRYKYDSLNRLIREDNKSFNKTYIYTYDSNGNILEKKSYDYSLDDNLENEEIISYNYNDFNDYLTNYNGQAIEYDSLGNPVIYKDISLKWNQHELISYGSNRYTYNVNHIRTSKENDIRKTDYILDGNRIIKEKITNYLTYISDVIDDNSYIAIEQEEIEYIYSNNKIIGFDYKKNNQTNRYYYNKNILGDILEIYDSNYNLVGKYEYDAWGNHNIVVNIHNIANINPFRYRGYYYDSETGLFMVGHRYYNPEWGRWLSPDDVEYLEPDNINGLNLYCYCENDPVNKFDPSGHFAISLTMLGLIIGAVVGATVGGVVAYNVAENSGAEGWELFGWTMAGIVGGGIIGGALGAGVGALVTKATGVIGLSITKYSVIPIKGTTVLGHMPGYIGAAQATGSGYYLVSNGTYDKMVQKGVEWYNNMTYLKDANTLGSKFALAPDYVVRSGGTFWKEIQYLIENGIPWEIF